MAAQIGIAVIPAAIASGQSLSAEVDLGAQTLIGVAVPSAWTSANLTFQASADGVIFGEFYSYLGAEITFTIAPSQFVAVDPNLFRGAKAIKVRSGTSASPVAQASAVILSLVVGFVA